MSIKILEKRNLSVRKYLLEEVDYEYTSLKNEKKKASKQVYNRGDGAAILLYNPDKKNGNFS